MKYINKFLVISGLLVFLFACDNDESVNPDPDPKQEELSKEADRQVQVNQYLESVRTLGFGAPGALLQDGSGLRGGRSNASSWNRMRNFMHGEGKRLDDGICVAQIFVLHDDGSFTWVIDFGDGCEIDGEFWKGKVVETYHIDEEAGTYRAFIGFEEFGQETWTINGLAALEGTYQDENGFSTEFTFVKNLEVTDEDETWSVARVGKESLNEQAWTILEMATDISYSNETTGDALIYKNLVVTPLVYDFTCGDHIVTFVSGVDAVKVNEKEFFLLFGEGECDNLIIVKEGIFEVVIDVSEDEMG